MTDIASEDGDEQPEAEQPTPKRLFGQDQTSDPIERPSTAATARTGVSSARGGSTTWSQAPPSKRGTLAGRTTISGGGSIGIAGGRPGSSTSRTHAPVAAHGFYRPMSSQRLQAQRSGRFSASEVPVPESHVANRSSLGSNGTLTQTAVQPSFAPTEARPQTQETDVTERDGLHTGRTSTNSPMGHFTARSESDSVSPLRGTDAGNTLSVDAAKTYRLGSSGTDPKSPKSFRSSFLLPTRHGSIIPDKASDRGSSRSSNQAYNDDTKELPSTGLGRNWEYFPGNTLFCLGGRWQTTRDRPINVATGFLVILPGALFFAFSASWLWHNVSPGIVIVFAYVFALCLSSFIHACVSDPGVSFLIKNLVKLTTNVINRSYRETCITCRHPRMTIRLL
jgi:palmitoyltransferase ZDHHC9/14/18